MSKLIERIEREAGLPGLASLLSERLSPTDLQSLMLEVYRLRSSGRRPAEVLAQYENDRFVQPARIPPDRLLAWERTTNSLLPSEVEQLVLSPVCPLGTSSVIAPVDQNWAVATARNTEVVSDSTNVMALECALRRREMVRRDPKSREVLHLATSQRLLRAQHYMNPALQSHFSVFALCSAGRDQGNLRFEIAALSLHISFYLKALQSFLGTGIPLQVAITDFRPEPRYVLLEAELLNPLRSGFPGVNFEIDDQRTGGKGYYLNLCFHLYATSPSGQPVELVDGGAVDWMRLLLSNAKERLVISGIGSERVCTVWDSK